ncbi:Fluorescent in blue light protein [Thalictrum thalictroides]|uniref:Fluorescent in blue light protein n=1 Tax=Thalictrum thalictroides TaxID=46969 RepID=A0A7J6VZU3_THATH|nr:Fluorescent in blue light protein [Thalictrum thalictroides]
MAMVVQSSLAPSCLNSIRSLRLYPAKISSKLNAAFGKPDLIGVLHAGIVKILNHASEARESVELEKVFCSESWYSSSTNSWANTIEDMQDFDQSISDSVDVILKQILAIQKSVSFRHPGNVFCVANVLMLIMPFEALAETCEASSSPFNMPLLLAVALIGATVGGLVARQRKEELQKLNNQLRQINAALRRQAKIESYAPSLSYAPVVGKIPEDEVIVDSRKHDLISRLKSGKNLLRNQDPEKAYVEFKAALELAQSVKDSVEEKKAARGLGASLQRQSKYKEAINYHSMVLSISERTGENSGNTEAYGAIADCYTELGDLEKAAKFYDHYIATLQTD